MNDDLISRRATIYNMANIAKNCAKSDKQKALIGRCIYMIENMSFVQPEQKTGRWMDTRGQCGEFMCSNCELLCCTNHYNYCPNCGAKMEVDCNA